jgi:lysophospholipase L1-like esterase
MPRKPLYYDSENGKKEVLGTSGSFEQVPDAPTSALPVEYPATYAAMQTSITADPTAKRDFFVSGDETNGGVATRYSYNGTVNSKLISEATNLYSQTNIEENKAVSSSDGSIVSLTDYAIVRSIVEGGQTYIFNGSVAALNARVRFETINGDLISFKNATIIPFTFTTPLDCAKVVLSIRSSGTSTSVYSSFTLTKVNPSLNLFDATLIQENKAINNSTGGFLTLAGWSIINGLKVEAGQRYIYSGPIDYTDARVRFEDISHNLLSFRNASNMPFSFITPANCEYISLMVHSSSNSSEAYSKFKIVKSIAKSSNWEGANITILGDSITQQALFYPPIKEATKGFVLNKGVGGATITPGYGTASQSLYERLGQVATTNPDLIVVFGGTNDWYYSVPIGASSDTVTTTFYGAFKNLITGLMSGNAGKPILVVTPIQRATDRTAYAAQKSYTDAILTICEMYGVPVLDLFRTSGITYENIATFTTDNTHPNATVGGPLIGRMIAAKIKSL